MSAHPEKDDGDFTRYLTSLADDLRESGREATAEDFIEAGQRLVRANQVMDRLWDILGDNNRQYAHRVGDAMTLLRSTKEHRGI